MDARIVEHIFPTAVYDFPRAFEHRVRHFDQKCFTKTRDNIGIVLSSRLVVKILRILNAKVSHHKTIDLATKHQ